MTGDVRLRVGLGAVGVAVMAYGVWSLRSVDWADWPSLLLWLGGGVIAHDVLLAPVVVAIGVLAARRLPDTWRAPMVIGLVVWGTVTLMAVPVLGRFGALADNPTLLDRPYRTSWVIGTLLVLVAVAVAGSVAGSVRRRRVAR